MKTLLEEIHDIIEEGDNDVDRDDMFYDFQFDSIREDN